MKRKICIICKQPKSPSDFYLHSEMSDGRLGKCKKCCIRGNRLNNYKKHGITEIEYNQLLKEQNHGCALCKEKFTGSLKRGFTPHIDHNHKCSEHVPRHGCQLCIRGILCGTCNRFRVIGLEFLHDEKLYSHPFLLQRPVLDLRKNDGFV